MTLKHAVAPLIEATGKLYGGRVPQVCAGTQEYFRDVYDHLLRINQSIDSLRDMVTTAITVNLSLITLAENEITKRLAAYAALVAVPTMIAGIYGMNFKHMPELDWHWGYPVAVAHHGGDRRLSVRPLSQGGVALSDGRRPKAPPRSRRVRSNRRSSAGFAGAIDFGGDSEGASRPLRCEVYRPVHSR